jgi:hypothetical protein
MISTMFVLWVAVPLLFLPVWVTLTNGRPFRHVATLHFVIYFFSIYAGAYQLYEEKGFTNTLFMWSVVLYPVLAILGVLAVSGLYGVTKLTTEDAWPRRPSTPTELRVVAVVAGGLFLLLGAYLLVLGPNIPLLTLIEQGNELGTVSRFEATKGYKAAYGDIGPLVWGSRILLDYFGIFLVVFEFCRARATQQGYGRLVLLMGVLALATVAFNERYPVVKLLLYFFVITTFGVVRPGVTMATVWKGTAAFFGLVPGIAIVHHLLTHGPGWFANVSGRFWSAMFSAGWVLFVGRVVRGQVTGLYYAFEVFPRYVPFLMGRSLTNPRGLLPYEHVSFGYLVYDWHLKAPPGVRGSDPSVFFAEVYANFGWPVCLLSMFAAGVVLQWTQVRFAERLETWGTPYDVALFYFAMVYVADFAIGFSTLYFDERFWLLVLMFWLPRLWRAPRHVSQTAEAPL